MPLEMHLSDKDGNVRPIVGPFDSFDDLLTELCQLHQLEGTFDFGCPVVWPPSGRVFILDDEIPVFDGAISEFGSCAAVTADGVDLWTFVQERCPPCPVSVSDGGPVWDSATDDPATFPF